ncbi:MAG: hypothetical protein IPF59_00115 [Ignavibacteria bacterium]|nr:hypothetical protein [Ignavibacteria bacterium]
MNRIVILLALVLAACTSTFAHDTLRWRGPSSRPIEYPIVTSCWGEDENYRNSAQLNNRLVVQVHNVKALLEQVVLPSNIALVLDNVTLDGIRAYSVNRYTGEVRFMLSMNEFNEVNNNAWAMVVGNPRSFERKVSVTVADATTGRQYATAVSKNHVIKDGIIKRDNSGNGYSLNLHVIRPLRLSFAVGLTVLILVLFYISCTRTGMLRASTAKFSDGRVNVNAPFSLAYVQMAFWYVIVVASSIFLWLVTDVLVPFPPSVLGVLGVATITGLTAAAYDAKVDRKLLSIDRDSPEVYKQSQGFIKDIVRDNTGTASLARVQMLVWTILFGLYYLTKVYQSITIPDIDDSMLVLMGLTSSAYVGSKLADPGAVKV